VLCRALACASLSVINLTVIHPGGTGFMLKRFFAIFIFACTSFIGAAQAQVPEDAPFKTLIGWWGGEGRLGFKEGKTETVKCRVTYMEGQSSNEVTQTIRCASPSGKVEIKSTFTANGKQVSGTWTEQVYNSSGDLSGQITDRGFRVTVAGTDLRANMDVIVKDKLQVIEIQFDTKALVGMTLVLKKG
jgi:hypothetical protein